MDRPVRNHILRLQRRIELLNAELMDMDDNQQRNRIEAEIRAANLAISHSHAALQLEEQLINGKVA